MERVLFPLIRDAALDGAKSAEDMLRKKDAGVGIDWALINERVRRWAERYAALLVKGITEVTRDGIRAAISAWMESGGELDELVHAVERFFSPERARAIAVTEVTRAYAEGNRQTWTAIGADGMMWMTAQDELVCDTCGDLAGQRVGIREQFHSGDFTGIPPAHPNCRCYLQPVIERPGRVELPPR